MKTVVTLTEISLVNITAILSHFASFTVLLFTMAHWSLTCSSHIQKSNTSLLCMALLVSAVRDMQGH